MYDIRKARETKGITQEHLAKAAGISVRTVRRIETAGGGSAETLMALKAVVGSGIAEAAHADGSDETSDRMMDPFERVVAIIAVHLVLAFVISVVMSVIAMVHAELPPEFIWLGLIVATFSGIICFVVMAGKFVIKNLWLVFCAAWTGRTREPRY